ncbi:MAG: polyprenol monophosphomannose synthase [Acidimicrobiales bacterium]
MRVLVVLPTYNERENIEAILRAVRATVPDASILVVDDSSPDGTAELAEKTAADLGSIEVLRRVAKNGLGPAYRDGFRWGLARGYEALVEMDSDFSHDPGELPQLLAALGGGVELVIGSRYIPGGSIPNWSLLRRLISRFGNIYAKVLLGLGVEDSTAGYRVYAAGLLERLDLDRVRADSYGFQIEMTFLTRQAGSGIVEVPIHFVDRVAGTSKMSTFTVVEAFTLVTGWGLRRILSPGKARRART